MKKITVVIATLAFLFLFHTAAYSALVMDTYLDGVDVTGDTIYLNIGDSYQLDLLISVDQALVSGGFEIVYNSAVIDITNVTAGSTSWFPMTNSWESGLIDYKAIVFPPGATVLPGDDMLFASLDLIYLGGADSLFLSITPTDDWVAATGDVLDGDIEGKHLVNVVPIPGAVWMLGSGIIALFGFNRRRKK